MNTVTLDTHKTILNLQANGFSTSQAESIVNLLTESELVTKQDLQIALAELRADFKVWGATALLAHAAVIVTLQNLLS